MRNEEYVNDLDYLFEKAKKYVLRYDTGYSLEQVEAAYRRLLLKLTGFQIEKGWKVIDDES